MDLWVDIPDFPGYQVNEKGLVYSDRHRKILKASPNQRDIYQVGMMQGTKQRKVAVSHLVAAAFLEPPRNDRFTRVIHLDGNPGHNFVWNLAWRPEGFARAYKKQFEVPYPSRINRDILLIQTEEVFPNSFEPAIKYGLLERAVCLSAWNVDVDTPCFPTGHIFKDLALLDIRTRSNRGL